jgi:NAD(P)-dependent dehydrogenase (short-subunit alcohol dehydrogenase family)
MSRSDQLTGRVAIVTGAGRGIGREHALALAAHGASVVVNDAGVALDGTPQGTPCAEETVAAIRSAGGAAVAHHGSVGEWSTAQELVDLAVERFGGLDVIVNNAGILRSGPIWTVTAEDLAALWSVHVAGTASLMAASARWWKARSDSGEQVDARIINTTSGAGLFPLPDQSAYGAVKSAVAQLTVSAAAELAPYGVTVNAIAPLALTRMRAASTGEQEPAETGSPLHPSGSSPLVAYLASPAAAWISGQVLRIEGSTVLRVRGWAIDGPGVPASGSQGEVDEYAAQLSGLFGAGPRTFVSPELSARTGPVHRG